jgi:hypothetical protein
MARRATTKKAPAPRAGRKPAQRSYVSRNQPKPKAAEVKPPEAPPLTSLTKPELLEQVRLVLDGVDQQMEERSWSIQFSHYGEFRDPGRRIEDLNEALHAVLTAEGGDPDQDLAGNAIRETFGAEPGTVPSWARPGRFLVWVGYVPFLCAWNGFAVPEAEITAVDPTQLWVTPGGTINATRSVPANCRTPDEMFRDFLRTSTIAKEFSNGRKPGKPLFNLHRLEGFVKEGLQAALEKPENAWIVAALKRGPVNPVPLPEHLQAVQTLLFA